MDGGLYERDFYTWTRVQADALRRLAEARPNLGAELDLPHLAEEVEDLGNEQVSKVRSHLLKMLKHMMLVAAAPDAPAVRRRRGEIVTVRDGASDPYRSSMRRTVEPQLDRIWRTARLAAKEKLDRDLPHLPTNCPFALEELLDEEAPLDPLLARLRPPTE